MGGQYVEQGRGAAADRATGEHFVDITTQRHGALKWVAATLTMKQMLLRDDGSKEPINRETAEKELGRFKIAIDAAVFGTAYRRHRKRLCWLATVEQGDLGDRWHGHALIEQPGHLSEAEFVGLLTSKWLRQRWSHGLNEFRPVYGGADGAQTWAGYICKSGWKADLIHVRKVAGPKMALPEVEDKQAEQGQALLGDLRPQA